MNCSQCNGPTSVKNFRSKAGKQCTIFECSSGCKDAKGYPLGTWPPKAPSAPASQGATNASAGQMVGLLSEILKALCRIEKMVANPGQVHIAQEELKPDDSSPF